MNEQRLCILASLLLALAVVTGAFGAHGLSTSVSPARMTVWQTAVLYHLIHALGLLAIAALAPQFGGMDRAQETCVARLLRLVAWCLLFGVILFSGSLYLLVLTDTPHLGAITPIGGTAFILGWLGLALAALRQATRHR